MFLLINLTSKAFGQEQSQRLNFILLIDKEIPIATIFDGYFLFKTQQNNIEDTIPFNYQVGGLMLTSSNYKKLFIQDSTAEIIIKFKYKRLFSSFVEIHDYEKRIPSTWINELYIILNIYNYYNATSRKKYYMRKGEYLIQLQVPGKQNVLPFRK